MSRRKDKHDWVWDHFEETVPMSTYLVAYTINDFEYKESTVKMTDDVVFRIWARRDAIDQVIYLTIYLIIIGFKYLTLNYLYLYILLFIYRWTMQK